jgi:predicted PurR-regulated permease PerM
VFIGAAIWGPIGAIIGVPITAVVVSIVETYGRRYRLIPHLSSPEEAGAETGAETAKPESSDE